MNKTNTKKISYLKDRLTKRGGGGGGDCQNLLIISHNKYKHQTTYFSNQIKQASQLIEISTFLT
jgi:hypothetical protein